MAIETDVQATKPLAATGQFLTQANDNCTFRTRMKGIYILCGASAGTVVIRDGGASGRILLTLSTPAVADTGYVAMDFPAQGIVAREGLYGTLTNAASVVLFYA